MPNLYEDQKRELRALAKVAKKFSRAADKLVNSAEGLYKHAAGSRGSHRANVLYSKRAAEYDRLQEELHHMVEVSE